MSAASRAQLKLWRERYQQAFAAQAAAFLARPQPKQLFKRNTQCLDTLLLEVWHHCALPDTLCLIAVGGYGRGEMYPYSDIDLLILLPDQQDAQLNQQVEQLIGNLWDIGLNIGHSVRTIDECLTEAQADVTVLTNLIEARLLTGEHSTFQHLNTSLLDHLDTNLFYQQKMREQQLRHAKFNDTAYNLEPNIKESPGGLRDLHMVLWMARSHCIGGSWQDLVEVDFIDASQAKQIARHERLLQDLRIRLHLLAKRREDRLIFDFQNVIAEQLGYQNTDQKRASEQLMQGFYRSARAIMIENEVLLKRMYQRCVTEHKPAQAIDEDFTLIQGNLLHLESPDLFHQKPAAILRCFLLLQKHPEIFGFSAALIRALQGAQTLIDAEFRQQAQHKNQFLALLNYPEGVHRGLRAMNRYGILGRYIPVFGRVIAQMQHDLFHVYTVDEHTLNVLGNLRRFAKPELQHEFPLCSQLFATFDRPALLYLAAIFHDIAKGRGGDHSELGTLDAKRFCRLHGLPVADTDLVAWLVNVHLKMSSTAQKCDLSDPDVIAQFAQLVGSEYRLVALYLLTVADIRGTSPNVWNAWKAKLLESLFLQTRRVLQQSLNSEAQLAIRKDEVLHKLKSFDMQESSVHALWQAFGQHYFSRFDSDEIAWQSRLLIPHRNTEVAIVRARLSPKGDGIQVMIYSRDQRDVFARICQFFDSMQYNIAQAKIFTTAHGYALDNFIVLEPETKQVSYNGLLKHIEAGLSAQLSNHTPLTMPMRGRVSRQVKHMPIKSQVFVRPATNPLEASQGMLQLDVIASDRPGLLAMLAHHLLTQQLALVNAKINTLGNRVEDSFIIAPIDGMPLTEAQINSLKAVFNDV